MRKKLMLILNPVAGKGGIGNAIGPVLEVLYIGGYAPTVFYTASVGDATELVLRHGNEYDCITCVGGDGTLSETVSGLAQLENPPLLGYIPMGTANDVATTLKLPRIPMAAAKTITHGVPVSLDVGRFNGSGFFTYVAAFGAFTEVSYETSKEMKQTLGHLGYVLTAMTRLSKLTDYAVRVEHDGGVIVDRLIFGSVSNSTSVAGILKLDKSEVSLDDGLFEVMLIRTPSNLAELNRIVTSVLSHNFNCDEITMFRSKNVRFSFDQPVKWTRDGESGGVHSELTLENIRAPIKIMA